MAGNKDIQTRYIFEKARRYCAYQERSVFDMKQKLFEWNIRAEVAKKIITSLEDENYLNEERFARVYAGGKFRIKKWGRNKIIAALKAKRLPQLIIQIGLEEIDESEYLRTLKDFIDKKKNSFDMPDSVTARNKTYNCLVSRGYEKHLILKYL